MDNVTASAAESLVEHSPLLRLPPELRERIFLHLIPSVPEIGIWAIETAMLRPRLREDGQPCCPALLRVNRKTHHELSRLWYSNQLYTVFLGPRRLRDVKHLIIFCGSRFFPREPLPMNLRLLRFVCLDIKLSYKAHEIAVLLTALVRQLSSPDIPVKKLLLRIMLPIELFVAASHEEKETLWAYLDANLGSIGCLRGGPNTEVQVFGDPGLSSPVWVDIIPFSRPVAICKLAFEYLEMLLGGRVIQVDTEEQKTS
ncbi:hypothetical protein GLAREA_09568 [Glarea lozoyensis ATCC 20868]|uniref:F-box domain-containing protein n=1 Tax=Glarea lozoyensis (strain ATCC 20868 / MF5171) TaxID=1116229 RepID=S3CPN8_GLAL2|nr:uncharacterized protein GLAREA_09568 [Glarea lozoyensis ATCC 20868]EPE28447.1 hypothetical protein GLAREA_09568 [Glarea lozoyensis ATCC 20868]